MYQQMCELGNKGNCKYTRETVFLFYLLTQFSCSIQIF